MGGIFLRSRGQIPPGRGPCATEAAVVSRIAAILVLVAFISGCGEPVDEFSGEGGVFDSPVGIVVNGRYAYVTNANFDLSDDSAGAITVIDLDRALVNRHDPVIERVRTPAYIGKMVMSPDRSLAYLANRGGDSVLIVDLSDPASPRIVDLEPGRDGDQGIRVGVEPFGLTMTPDGEKLFVANVRSGDLSIVDVAERRLIKNELLNFGINEVAVDPLGRYAYVTNRGLASVVLIDVATNRFVTAFALGSRRTGVGIDTRGIDFTPDGRFAFVAARSPESVLVIDTDKIPGRADAAIVDILPADEAPTAVRVTPDGAEVWVTNFVSNNVIIYDVDSRGVLEVIPTGLGPYDIAFTEPDDRDPEQYYALIANFDSHNVSLMDARTKEYIWVIP
ncbi:beta-propeller fold lactonase family protein [bacterium]|nr:beta-propeller fold lactonase family protein [bacterium]